MSRLRLLTPILLLATVSACDRLGEVVLVPEAEVLDSFESGVGGWTTRTADLGTPPGDWSVEGTQEAASDGVRALRVHVDNTSGAGKVWLVRSVELSPLQDYDVVLTFDLGTPDAPGTAPWTLIAGAYPTEPQAAALTFRGGTVPDSVGTDAVTWVEERYESTVRATSEGAGIVVLGLWGTTAEARTYYLDNVRVLFTRR